MIEKNDDVIIDEMDSVVSIARCITSEVTPKVEESKESEKTTESIPVDETGALIVLSTAQHQVDESVFADKVINLDPISFALPPTKVNVPAKK